MAKMAKKIRQVKQSKLKEEDINKNNGKEISHTISKIKEHEQLYTFFLVIIFMITICLSIFLGLRVDSYKIYDSSLYDASMSMSGELVALSKENVQSDMDGLQSPVYTLKYKNNLGRDINFIIRFSPDVERIESCGCENKIVDYQKIKFSLDGKTVQQFTDETMIITAGMLKSRNNDELKIRIWLDESLTEQEECYYFGKFLFEELEDMDS